MATARTVLFTSKKYKDGSSPIMLRITKNKQLKYFKIGDEKFNIKPEKWNYEYGLVKADKRVNPEHLFLNGYINEKLNQATKIIENFDERKIAWTFNMFEKDYRTKPKVSKVKSFIELKITDLQGEGRYSTATGIKETLVILEKYYPKFKNLYFQDIDYKFIVGFYLYLKNVRGNKDTTIGINLRNIRWMLNEAITDKCGSRETYPFSEIYGSENVFLISKLEKSNGKKYIPKEYIIKLVNANIIEYHLNWARQIFLFSFFGSGINFKDMAFLQKKNIETNIIKNGRETKYITFKRKKTKNDIIIPITENVAQILKWAKANTTNDNEYLLPIITNKKLTGEKLINHITQRRKRFNKHLRTIVENLEFPESLLKISSYYARHSYASIMLKNGVQVELISQALGHKDIKTTQIYLKSFDVDDLRKPNEDLLKDKIRDCKMNSV